ncbi:peptidyl-prolyl cis-trans isomerase B [Escherichia coli]|nr:peptidyl-prolyl cis-trans isomerase B [Escherichia coli]
MQKWLLSTPITAILSSKLLTIKHLKQLKNFLDYCREGFYNNTIFHRVINGFMIQGGGFERA